MTRTEILEAARGCVCGDREEDYGSPEDSFGLIAELGRAYIARKCVSPGAIVELLPEDVAALMALLKIARTAAGAVRADNWVDLAGYAACGGELNTRGGRT